jgi:tellurite resistance protein TerC
MFVSNPVVTSCWSQEGRSLLALADTTTALLAAGNPHAVVHSMAVTWIAFVALATGTLYVDMVVFDPKGQKVSTLRIVMQALFIQVVSLAVGVAIGVLTVFGWEGAGHYFVAYFSEDLLSIDNLFVISVVINKMGVPNKYRQYVLSTGILISIVLRIGLLIGGAQAVAKFGIISAFLGAGLAVMAAFMLRDSTKAQDPEKDPAGYKYLRKIPITEELNGRKPWGRNRKGKLRATMMLIFILSITLVCILFGFDSLPVVLGITTTPFIVISSNVMALSGQRSTYALFEMLDDKVSRLSQGVACILLWMGFSMVVSNPELFELFGADPLLKVSDLVNFLVIMGILGVTCLVSWIWPLVIPEPKVKIVQEPAAPHERQRATELYIDSGANVRSLWVQGLMQYYAQVALLDARLFDSDQLVPVYQYGGVIQLTKTVRIGEEFTPERLVLGKQSDLVNVLRHIKQTATATEGDCQFIIITNGDGVDERLAREAFAELPLNAFVWFVYVPGTPKGLALLRALDHDYEEGGIDRCALFDTNGAAKLPNGITDAHIARQIEQWRESLPA